MKTYESWGEEYCRGCHRKVWQDADGNIRCTHAKGCAYYAEMSSGKNKHSKAVQEEMKRIEREQKTESDLDICKFFLIKLYYECLDVSDEELAERIERTLDKTGKWRRWVRDKPTEGNKCQNI